MEKYSFAHTEYTRIHIIRECCSRGFIFIACTDAQECLLIIFGHDQHKENLSRDVFLKDQKQISVGILNYLKAAAALNVGKQSALLEELWSLAQS